MNKHLFVIFLTTFSSGLCAMDYLGAAHFFDRTVPNKQEVGKFVVVGCGLEVTPEHLASPSSSASSSQASSPELERRVLAILHISGQSEQQKARAIVAILEEASKRQQK